MKRTLLKALCLTTAVLMIAAMLPIALLKANADGEPTWTVPAGYNENDYNCCAAFLEQTNSNGETNGSLYSDSYDVNDPETWGSYWHTDDDGFTRLYPRFEFALVNGELRIRKIWLIINATLHTVGSFDFSNCTALEEVYAGSGNYNEFDFSGDSSLMTLSAGGNGRETQLNVSGCTALRFLDFCGHDLNEMDLSDCSALTYLACSCNTFTELDLTHNTALKELLCEVTPLTQVDLTNCPDLEFIRLKDNMLTELDLSHNPLLPVDRVFAVGGGTIGYYFEQWDQEQYTCVYAVPNEGEGLIGWYNGNNEFLSNEELYIPETNDTVFKAVFTGGSAPEPIPGDVDGSGTVNVSDAIMALRASMGLLELTNDQFTAADMDGSNTVTVSDAIMILRTAMGLV